MKRNYKLGIMASEIHSTEGFKLLKGDRVKVYEATNLPSNSAFEYFVAPIHANGNWLDYSIAAYKDDVIVD